jgi:hypothetical protein
VVKITSESQLHQLPPEMAQRIAMRLKSSMPPGTPGAGGSASEASAGNSRQGTAGGAQAAGGGTHGGGTNGGAPGGMRAGGGGDFQQILNRMPTVTLADLHKGDAVVIVATEGAASASTAITLLTGVEPILQAVPTAGQAMMLTPWSLGGAPAADAQ